MTTCFLFLYDSTWGLCLRDKRSNKQLNTNKYKGSTVSALTIVAVAICKARGDWLRAHYYDAVG